MLMNHRGVTDQAFIRYTVTWEDASAALTPVKPYWLDERNCRADPIFNVPGTGGKRSTYRPKYDFTMPESGRIVAGGGHVHGGARNLVVSEPDCGNRIVFTSRPAWGMPSHPFYHVRPILHEPGPISMSGYLSHQGYPVAAGQRVRLTASYDNSRAHTRVMGISLLYVAPQSVNGCASVPTDGKTFQPAAIKGVPFRTAAPRFTVPLTGIGKDGKAHTISGPPGRTVKLANSSSIKVGSNYFATPNASIPPSSTLTWRFGSSALHNVTLANGPQGFASYNLSDGRTFKFRFKRPGMYRIFCALHPVEMTETVTVRRHKKH
jgi:plastocyanin